MRFFLVRQGSKGHGQQDWQEVGQNINGHVRERNQFKSNIWTYVLSKLRNNTVHRLLHLQRPASVQRCGIQRLLLHAQDTGTHVMYVTLSWCFFTNTAIPKLYSKVKLKVEESLSTTKWVALICDAWTSRAVDSRMINSILSQRTGNCCLTLEQYMKVTLRKTLQTSCKMQPKNGGLPKKTWWL